jgi:hypothetical protein
MIMSRTRAKVRGGFWLGLVLGLATELGLG